MHLFFFTFFWWQTNLGRNHYPAGAQLAIVQGFEERGASEAEAKRCLKATEDTFTFHQAIQQYIFFIEHGKLTNEARQVYFSCRN